VLRRVTVRMERRAAELQNTSDNYALYYLKQYLAAAETKE
jgi:hypothetical protein